MTAEELLRQPLCLGGDLGKPMPSSEHAVSMALPNWEHVVGYEEQRPEVVSRLACGYPRFVIHRLVGELSRRICRSNNALVFPSVRTAQRALDFVRRRARGSGELVDGEILSGVRVTEEGWESLKLFWQHTGQIVSTRQAAFYLGDPGLGGSREALVELRGLLAEFYGCSSEDVFLTPTGMAAQDIALRVLRRRMPGRPTVQLGFPYVDTLKLQQRFGDGAELLHHLDSLETELRRVFQRGAVAGAFCEIPGNPLLGSADLRRISPILRAAGAPLVADDVVATPWNVDLSGYADLVATSLTKYVVGTGDAMGGAVICNPKSPYYRELRRLVDEEHEELLWPADAAVILDRAKSFPERMRRHNANGLTIAERLRRHPGVERVWYPKWEFPEVYEAVRKPEGGWGSLVTFMPKDAARRSPLIYDALEVCKGPSLGTVFTLACPFTLLAHYTELEWAEACGVSRYLIRLSVGLEDVDELWGRIVRALDAATHREC
ncbi:MAG: PLP-dependent transferase [Limisphaerales bacterium]|jgi:cystathionine gamma-synthase